MVQKGDVLVEIDPQPYEANLKQAEGTLDHDPAACRRKRRWTWRSSNAIRFEGTLKADEGTVDFDWVQLSFCHAVSPITGSVGLRLVDPGNTVFAGTGSTLVAMMQLQPITVVAHVTEIRPCGSNKGMR